MFGLREEVWQNALVEFSLSDDSSFKKSLSCGIKGAVEECQECGSVFGENGFLGVID
jgi:hypothetical protein